MEKIIFGNKSKVFVIVLLFLIVNTHTKVSADSQNGQSEFFLVLLTPEILSAVKQYHNLDELPNDLIDFNSEISVNIKRRKLTLNDVHYPFIVEMTIKLNEYEHNGKTIKGKDLITFAVEPVLLRSENPPIKPTKILDYRHID